MRLHADKNWNQFLFQTAISPYQQWAVYAVTAILPCVFACVFIVSFLCGMGLFDVTGMFRMLPLLICFSGWLVCLQILLGVALARSGIGKLLLIVSATVWVAQLCYRLPGTDFATTIESDWSLQVIGLRKCAEAFQSTGCIGVLLILHLGIVTAVASLCAFRLFRNPPVESTRIRLKLLRFHFLTTLTMRYSRGEFAANLLTESLRISRGKSIYMTAYMGAAILTIVWAKTNAISANQTPPEWIAAIPLLLPALLIADGVPEMLRHRRGNIAYELMGADHRWFCISFYVWIIMLALGLILLTSTIAPEYAASVGWLPLISGTLAASTILIPLSVAINGKPRKRAGKIKISLLHLAIQGGILLIVPFIFHMLAARAVIVTIAFAAIAILSIGINTQRSTIRILYWKLYD